MHDFMYTGVRPFAECSVFTGITPFAAFSHLGEVTGLAGWLIDSSKAVVGLDFLPRDKESFECLGGLSTDLLSRENPSGIPDVVHNFSRRELVWW